MNNNDSHELERSPLDFIGFASVFFGLLVVGAGFVTNSIPVTVVGSGMVGLPSLYFLATQPRH